MTKLIETAEPSLHCKIPGRELGRILRKLLDEHADSPGMSVAMLQSVPRGHKPSIHLVPPTASQQHDPSVSAQAREKLIRQVAAELGFAPGFYDLVAGIYAYVPEAMQSLFEPEFLQSRENRKNRVAASLGAAAARPPLDIARFSAEQVWLDLDFDESFESLVWAMWTQVKPVSDALSAMANPVSPWFNWRFRSLNFQVSGEFNLIRMQTSLVLEAKSPLQPLLETRVDLGHQND